MNAETTAAPRMHDVAPHDRPREKLARVGVAALGDNELVALVIGHGSSRMSALGLATAVLTRAGGLRGLARTTLAQLSHVPALGPARAARLLAAVELGRRTLTVPREPRPRFASPRELAHFLLPQFGARPVEHFGIVLLDLKHRLLQTTVVSIGSLDASVVQPRDVFREAALGGSAALVLFHNHPSGDPTPSQEDLAITRRMIAAGQVMGIDVLDHVILADDRYVSLRESGRLP
jgi:DNA repair protein RadC